MTGLPVTPQTSSGCCFLTLRSAQCQFFQIKSDQINQICTIPVINPAKDTEKQTKKEEENDSNLEQGLFLHVSWPAGIMTTLDQKATGHVDAAT